MEAVLWWCCSSLLLLCVAGAGTVEARCGSYALQQLLVQVSGEGCASMADDDCAIADALKMKPDSCRSVLQMQFPICSDLRLLVWTVKTIGVAIVCINGGNGVEDRAWVAMAVVTVLMEASMVVAVKIHGGYREIKVPRV
ncbi:hypothetical protein DEO72_LG8g2273 [Vigna unguiculata]|uniref:Bifunctional inhibitor/plant lipid transfer protein/seed storage helical domain-containing protein n=1 Tax=Vigna unguiculata TaxID=3917 RepID=A0A4D6MVW9_VIGUN|nr:hypothetical protein DEO72_LG8g2273 [Vigna unguiculata]